MLIKLCKKVLLTVILFSTVYSVSAHGGMVPFFQGSFTQLQQQAQIKRTPYFVYFFVDDCKACMEMDKETFNNQRLVQFVEKNFLAAKVDGLDFINGIDIVAKYGVTKYPTTLVFGPDGNIRNRVSGFLNAASMFNMLQKEIKEGDLNTSAPIVSRGISTTTRSADPINQRIGTPANKNIKFDSQYTFATPSQAPSNLGTYDSNPYAQTSNFTQNPSILNTGRETDPPASATSRTAATHDKHEQHTHQDKDDYIKSYLNNRMNGDVQTLDAYSSSRYYRAGTSYNSDPNARTSNAGNSYVDDYSRANFREATDKGYIPKAYYSDPPAQNNSNRNANSANTSNDYGGLSYVDEQTKANPQLAYRGGDQNSASYPNNQRMRSNEPSFLDYMDGSSANRGGDDYGDMVAGENGNSRDNNNYWDTYRYNGTQSSNQTSDPRNEQFGSEDYAIDWDGRRIAVRDLKPGVQLEERNGEYYIIQSQVTNNASGQTRGSATPNQQATYRQSQQPAPVTRKVNPSIPGMSQYSPEGITDNTFSIVIGDFVSLSKLKEAIEDFEENNEESIWVFGEKINNRHYYKLAMGEFRGEQEAVSSALRMGASWEQIKVVNLANLN